MKKRSLIAPVAVALLIFFGGCFANASFDIRTWDGVDRGLVASLMFIGAVIAFATSEDTFKV